MNCNVDVYDPWLHRKKVLLEYGINLIENLEKNKYDAIILAVAHDIFYDYSISDIKLLGKPSSVIYDVKYLFNSNEVDGRL